MWLFSQPHPSTRIVWPTSMFGLRKGLWYCQQPLQCCRYIGISRWRDQADTQFEWGILYLGPSKSFLWVNLYRNLLAAALSYLGRRCVLTGPLAISHCKHPCNPGNTSGRNMGNLGRLIIGISDPFPPYHTIPYISAQELTLLHRSWWCVQVQAGTGLQHTPVWTSVTRVRRSPWSLFLGPDQAVCHEPAAELQL